MMNKNSFVQTPTHHSRVSRESSQKINRHPSLSSEGSSKRGGIVSPNNIVANSSGKKTSANIMYKNISGGKSPKSAFNTSSPVKVFDQSSYSAELRSGTPQLFEARSNAPVRTGTYSPVSNSKIASSNQKQNIHGTSFDPGSFFYESPGKKLINLGNSSVQVMKKVFDEDYSLHSPSKKKAYEDELKESSRASKNEQKNLNISQPSEQSNSEIDSEILNHAYKVFLEKLQSNPKMQSATIDLYISESLGYLLHPSNSMKLGAIINLFDMLYYNRDKLTEDQISHICTQFINLLPRYSASDDPYLIYCSLEVLGNISFPLKFPKSLLAIIGPSKVLFDNINALIGIMCENNFPRAREKAFKILTDLDYPGFFALIELANKDFNQLPLEILNLLAQCPEILTRVIVPSLLNSFGSNDQKKKYSSLAALNRMFGMVKFGGGLPVLIPLLNEGVLDRELIASTILASGPIGEQTIIKVNIL